MQTKICTNLEYLLNLICNDRKCKFSPDSWQQPSNSRIVGSTILPATPAGNSITRWKDIDDP